MSESMKQAISNGYLLQICQDFITEVCEEAEKMYRLKPREIKAITCGNTKRVKSVVMWRGIIVFEVSFLASPNMGYFFYMTKEQARDTFSDFFQVIGGKAA